MPGEKSAEYPLFDWLRFLLAAAVAFSHSNLIPWDQAGNFAVQVFFALSGFLIGGILIRSTPKSFPQFYFNRATRVWIPYFFAVVSLYTVSSLHDPINASWFRFLFYDVTFTHNWFTLKPDAAAAIAIMPLRGTGNHFWVAVEEQFYVFSPLIILSSRPGKSWQPWAFISLMLLLFDFVDFASISFGVLAATLNLSPLIGLIPLSIGLAIIDHYDLAAPLCAVGIVILLSKPGQRTALQCVCQCNILSVVSERLR